MRAKCRLIAAAAWLVALTGATACLAAEPAAKETVKPKPARPKITISKETTYITSPLRPDGYPDYLAALNELCSRGVMSENNAAVPFWRAVGPKSIPAELRPQFFRLLGIEELPEKGAYLVSMDEFWTLRGEERNVIAQQRLWDQLDSGRQKPWSAEESPDLAAWLALNEAPLNVLVWGVERARFYSPSIIEEGKSLTSWVHMKQIWALRESIRLLTARALLRVKSGKPEEAWQDLLACHRLGRLLGQSQDPFNAIMGFALEGDAWKTTVSLAHYGSLTGERAAKFQTDLAGLPPLKNVADTWCVGSRYFTLDSICLMADIGARGLPAKPGVDSRPVERLQYAALERLVVHVRVEWDEVLRLQNDHYDRMAEALGKPDYAQRRDALDRLRAEAKDRERVTLDPQLLAQSLAKDASAKAVAQHLIAALWADAADLPKGLMSLTERTRTHVLLSQLAFALAGYRADHGKYPATLAELKPKYIPEIPKDLFTDKDLIYKPQDGGKGYVLYSLGSNGRDDGALNANDDDSGKYDNVDLAKRPDDIAVRTPDGR